MIRDKDREKSEDGSTQNNEGLKRRDLLLSGTSMMDGAARFRCRQACASAAAGRDGANREKAECRLYHG